MKNKFENQENGSMLGTTIQQVRKAKGITQEELAEDLFKEAFDISEAAAREAVKDLWDNGDYDPARTEAFIRKMCERRAQMMNDKTYDELVTSMEEDSFEDEDALKATPKGVFDNAEKNRSKAKNPPVDSEKSSRPSRQTTSRLSRAMSSRQCLLIS